MRSNRNFREALESGYVPIGSSATRLLAGESFDAADALATLRQEENRGKSNLFHSTDDFEVSRWMDDIDTDYDALSETLERVKDIAPADDDKLRALKRFLETPEVKSGKALVFSEAETTIEYLHAQINPDGKDRSVARLSGSSGRLGERGQAVLTELESWPRRDRARRRGARPVRHGRHIGRSESSGLRAHPELRSALEPGSA